MIARSRLHRRRDKSLLPPFGLVFGGRLSDPRARRGNRGSGLARVWKESQAMIVGGISLEAAPPTRQDYAETASIIVNGRKGLHEHGHRGAFPVAVSSARPAIGRAACPLVGHPKAAPQHGASNSYSAARSSQSRPLVLPTPNGATPPAITASAMARSDAGACSCPRLRRPGEARRTIDAAVCPQIFSLNFEPQRPLAD